MFPDIRILPGELSISPAKQAIPVVITSLTEQLNHDIPNMYSYH